jgi:hypothetical protein
MPFQNVSQLKRNLASKSFYGKIVQEAVMRRWIVSAGGKYQYSGREELCLRAYHEDQHETKDAWEM